MDATGYREKAVKGKLTQQIEGVRCSDGRKVVKTFTAASYRGLEAKVRAWGLKEGVGRLARGPVFRD